MLDLFKHLRPQNLGGSEATENAQSSHRCSVPSHHKPNIFASNDCSKVVVVLGASQVYIHIVYLGIILFLLYIPVFLVRVKKLPCERY